MKQHYKDHAFQPASKKLIEQVNAICEEYQLNGLSLTLRQLFYQFVARALLTNNQRTYKRLGTIVNDGRLAGLIDWDHIVDRTRFLRELPWWRDPASLMADNVASFLHDKWAAQPVRIEVWVEKDALIGILEAVCDPEQVPYFSCRGYVSQTEVWRAAEERISHYLDKGQNVIILYLGDHDPSGLNMGEDLEGRLTLFLGSRPRAGHWVQWRDRTHRFIDYCVEKGLSPKKIMEDPDFDKAEKKRIVVEAMKHERYEPGWQFKRIALTMDQIEHPPVNPATHQPWPTPPPNDAKLTDSRAGVIRNANKAIVGIVPGSYIDRFSTLDDTHPAAERAASTPSWELDALDPVFLADLIRAEISAVKDAVKWQESLDREDEDRDLLQAASTRWAEVKAMLMP